MKNIYFDLCAIPIYILILFTCRIREMTRGRANRLFLLVNGVSLACAILDIWMEFTVNPLPLSPDAIALGTGISFAYKYLRNGSIVMYFIYIFSIVVASMANVRALDFSGALWTIGFLAFIEVVSLTLQVLFARLFKVDADTAVIASVTYINSPPFVPMIAASMKNSRVLMPGLSIGIIGYAAGNYLGVLICQLLG